MHLFHHFFNFEKYYFSKLFCLPIKNANMTVQFVFFYSFLMFFCLFFCYVLVVFFCCCFFFIYDFVGFCFVLFLVCLLLFFVLFFHFWCLFFLLFFFFFFFVLFCFENDKSKRWKLIANRKKKKINREKIGTENKKWMEFYCHLP